MFYQKDLICRPQGSGGSVTMYEFGLAGWRQTIEMLKNIMRWTEITAFLSCQKASCCTLYSLQVMRDRGQCTKNYSSLIER